MTASDGPPRSSATGDAIRTIAALTKPDEFVITDLRYVTFEARRLVPPPLAEPSGVRLPAGKLTGGETVAAATTYPGGVALLWGTRLRLLESFMDWLDERYQPAKIYRYRGERPMTVYVRRDGDLRRTHATLTAGLKERLDVEFGGALRLGAYGLESDRLSPGGVTALTMEWEAITNQAFHHRVVLRLIGADGLVRDQVELPLVRQDRWEYTGQWPPGQWVILSATITVPSDAPSGRYELRIGVLDPESRLPVPVRTAASRAVDRSEREIPVGVVEVD